VELVIAVVSQCEFKSDEEITQLHQAVDISVDMHVAAMKFARPGMIEAQVTAEIHKIALAAGFMLRKMS
jgi:Xaa-Pro aminopeptidase